MPYVHVSNRIHGSVRGSEKIKVVQKRGVKLHPNFYFFSRQNAINKSIAFLGFFANICPSATSGLKTVTISSEMRSFFDLTDMSRFNGSS